MKFCSHKWSSTVLKIWKNLKFHNYYPSNRYVIMIKNWKKNKELLNNYHILDYYQLLLFNSFLLSIQIE